MIRLFLPPEKLSSQQVIITGDQARYLSSVVRIKPGELLSIFDGQGRRYICKSLRIHKKEVIAEKVEEEIFSAESPLSLTLAQGIPKGEKMDLIIQKSTELGVKKSAGIKLPSPHPVSQEGRKSPGYMNLLVLKNFLSGIIPVMASCSCSLKRKKSITLRKHSVTFRVLLRLHFS
jgi:hypothetical protein